MSPSLPFLASASPLPAGFLAPAPAHAGPAFGVPGWLILFGAVGGLWLAIAAGVAAVDRLLVLFER